VLALHGLGSHLSSEGGGGGGRGIKRAEAKPKTRRVNTGDDLSCWYV
jgi:hypothetical protein